MMSRNITIAVAAVLAVSLLGCHRSPTAPGQPQKTSDLGSVTGDGKGGNGGGKGGGGTVLKHVTLTLGMTAEGDMPVQVDSSKTLDLEGPMEVTTHLSPDNCQQIQGDPDFDESVLEAFLSDAILNTFRTVIIVDRGALGGVSTKHRITLGWDKETPDDRNYLMNVRDGENLMGLSVTENPEGGTFTFTGGDIRIVDKSISGPPKNRVIVRCDNKDSITVEVSSSSSS